MKSLQERMNDLKGYFRGIEMYNDALIVKVCYPDKWRVYPTDDERIKVAPSEERANEYFYYGDSNVTSYDEIFDLIENTVKTNNEVFLKLELLKKKMEELKEMFSNNDYEALQTLTFELHESVKAKPSRKYTKRKKTAIEAKKDETNDSAEEIKEDA